MPSIEHLASDNLPNLHVCEAQVKLSTCSVTISQRLSLQIRSYWYVIPTIVDRANTRAGFVGITTSSVCQSVVF